jgi:quercetin dioxygenase-like cupin family protein
MKYVFKTEPGIRYRFPNHITDLVVDRTDARCSEVFVTIMQQDAGNPLHRHPEAEQIFYVIEGAGMLMIGLEREEYPIVQGDVVRIPPDTWHSVRAHGSPIIKYLCVDCFPGELPANERTWDDHIKVVCDREGWDISAVRKEPPKPAG